jgi:hypothetical protein
MLHRRGAALTFVAIPREVTVRSLVALGGIMPDSRQNKAFWRVFGFDSRFFLVSLSSTRISIQAAGCQQKKPMGVPQ